MGRTCCSARAGRSRPLAGGAAARSCVPSPPACRGSSCCDLTRLTTCAGGRCGSDRSPPLLRTAFAAKLRIPVPRPGACGGGRGRAEPETRRSFEGRRPGGAIVTHGESDDPDLRLRLKPSEMSTRESGARRPLQRGRRPELQNLGGLDPDRFARLRIAALARPALGDGEGAEVADGVAAFLLRFFSPVSISPNTKSTMRLDSALLMLPFLATFSMNAALLMMSSLFTVPKPNRPS